MKYLLLLSTLTLSLMFSSTSSARWTEFAETIAGDKYYTDLDSIRKNDGYVYVWTLADKLKPTERGHMSTKVYYEIDCKGFRLRALTYIFYKQPMGGGEGLSANDDNPEWRLPPADSVIETLFLLRCAQW